RVTLGHRESWRPAEGAAQVPRDFGALCNAIFDEAVKRGFSCTASEYKRLNELVDREIASVIGAPREDGERGRIDDASSARDSASCLSRARAMERGIRRVRGLVERTLMALRAPASAEVERGRVVVVDLLRDVVRIAVAERGVLVRVFARDDLVIDGDSALLAS